MQLMEHSVRIGDKHHIAHLNDTGGGPIASEVYFLFERQGPTVNHDISVDMEVDPVAGACTHHLLAQVHCLEHQQAVLVQEQQAVLVVDQAEGLGGCVGEQEQDLAAVEVFLQELAGFRVPDLQVSVLGRADDPAVAVDYHASDIPVVSGEGPWVAKVRQVPYPYLIVVELSPARCQKPSSLQQSQLPMVALDAFYAPKGPQMLRLSVNVPHLDLVVVAARKQPKLSIMLERSDERLMRLDGLVREIVLVEKLAVIGAEVEAAPCVDGGSQAIFGADGDLMSSGCFFFELSDTGYPDLQVLERASDECSRLVFLFDIDDVPFLVDQLRRTRMPILHPTLLHLLQLLYVSLADDLGLLQEAFQLLLEGQDLGLDFFHQLVGPNPQSRE